MGLKEKVVEVLEKLKGKAEGRVVENPAEVPLIPDLLKREILINSVLMGKNPGLGVKGKSRWLLNR